MHISNAQIQKVLEVHLHKVYATQNRPKAASASGPDELVLSSRAQQMQQIKDALQSTPAVRADVVADAKGQVEAGTYGLSSNELASAMLNAARQFRSIG